MKLTDSVSFLQLKLVLFALVLCPIFLYSQEYVCIDVVPYVEKSQAMRGISRYDLKWTNGSEINVNFVGGTTGIRNKVIKYASYWEKHANVRFTYNENKASDILISFESGGSWSYIGIESRKKARQGMPSMNFGWFDETTEETNFRRTILHEFGHALGLLHEHQHPSSTIKWNVPKVMNYYQSINGWSIDDIQKNVIEKYSVTLTNHQYDPQSIMHYYISNEFTLNDYSVPWNTVLSKGDMALISEMYPEYNPTVVIDKAITNGVVTSSINALTVTHNVFDDKGQAGMRLQIGFNIRNAINEKCELRTTFREGKNEANIKANSKMVQVSKIFIPSTNNETYAGFEVYVPYAKFGDMLGRKVLLDVTVIYDGAEIFKSGVLYFYMDDLSGPKSNKNMVLIKGKQYQTIEVDGKVWMAENLRTDQFDGKICTYKSGIEPGKMYSWETAMEIASSIKGWRIPTTEEWKRYLEYTNGIFVFSGKEIKKPKQNIINGAVVNRFEKFNNYCFFGYDANTTNPKEKPSLWVLKEPTASEKSGYCYYPSDEKFSIRLIKD